MGAAVAALLGLGASGFAQDSPAAQKKFYSRKSTFRIPIRIDEKERDSIQELQLFVRMPDGVWGCTEHADVTQTAFSFQANRDGEYWFCIVTVDKAGKPTPADPTKEDPGLIVVVDTQMPEIDVRPLGSGAGHSYLQCKLADANPDYASMRIEYQSTDGTWKALESVPNTVGVVQLPAADTFDGRIRLHVADKAGNVLDREMDLNPSRPPELPPAIRNTAAAGSSDPSIRLVNDSLPPLPGTNPTLPPLSGAVPITAINDRPRSEPVPRPVTTAPLASEPRIITPSTSRSEKMSLPNGPAVVVPPVPSSPQGVLDPSKLPTLGLEGGPSEGAPLVNSTKCRIDFAVDFTPKGISQVEVWITADDCRTWRMAGISSDGKSPVVVDFPGDGKFGYMFRVKPQRGLCPPPPKAGDPVDGWLEVDVTKPTAELMGAALDDNKDTGQLVISWSAKDANLDAQPVSLYYALQPTGPWQPIALKIANLGNHRWNVPNGVGTEVYVRLEVTDRAGNVSHCDTPTPVQIAAPRPKVRVLNVAPAKP
jgi:hypothetical protein